MKLLIRADASPEIGTGHVMRCLALAQAWQEEGGGVVFLSTASSPLIEKRLRQEGVHLVALHDAEAWSHTLAAITAERPDWVVLDGYSFTPGHHLEVRNLGPRLLVIDDYAHLPRYEADLVLNQNFGAETLHYIGGPYTKFLLGPFYALLRREFRQGPRPRKASAPVRRLLLTLGGSDPDNYTLRVLTALEQVPGPLDITVVAGAHNHHGSALARAARVSCHEVRLLKAPMDMARLMAEADLAIAGGGATMWELLHLGVPSLFLCLADNQKPAVAALGRQGFPVCLEPHRLSPGELTAMLEEFLQNAPRRRHLVRLGRGLVDGRGAERVVRLMNPRPWRVLLLGGPPAPDLARWLREQGEEVIYTEKTISSVEVARLQPDLIVSYNYKYILPKEIIELPGFGAINLHISYLPWNRGAHPNVWSFLDDTPKGVTIHYIDEGIDTGDILFQKLVYFDETKETLKSSYEKLHLAIQDLFKENWEKIKIGAVTPMKQIEQGTLHYVKDAAKYQHLIQEAGWDTPVASLKGKAIAGSGHVSQP